MEHLQSFQCIVVIAINEKSIDQINKKSYIKRQNFIEVSKYYSTTMENFSSPFTMIKVLGFWTLIKYQNFN